MSDLGYVCLDAATLRRAEDEAEGNASSAVVRRASVEPASARVRRLRGLAQKMLAEVREGR